MIALMVGFVMAALAVPAAHAWNLVGTTVNVGSAAIVTQGPRQAQIVADGYWTGTGGFIFNYNGADMDLALRTNCSGIGYGAIQYLCNSTTVADDIAQICPSGNPVVSAQGNLQAVTSFNGWTDPCDFQ